MGFYRENKTILDFLGAAAAGALTGGLGGLGMGWGFAAGAQTGLMSSTFYFIGNHLLESNADEEEQENDFSRLNSTQIKEGSIKPVVYGSTTVHGVLIDKHLSSSEKNQTLDAKFLLAEHYLPTINTDTLKINKTSVNSDFKTNNTETKSGTVDQTAISFFPSSRTYVSVGTEVTDADYVEYTASSSGLDDLEIFIEYPNGLYEIDAKYIRESADFIVQYKKTTDGSWTTLDSAWTHRAATASTLRFGFSVVNNGGTLDPASIYMIRLKRNDTVHDTRDRQSTSILSYVNEVVNEAFTHPGHAILAYKGLDPAIYAAGDVFETSIEVSRGTFDSDYDDTIDGYLDGKASSNPAYVILDILTNKVYGRGDDISNINTTEFEAFASYCVTNSLTVNNVINAAKDAWETALGVAFEYGALIYDDGTQVRLTIDQDETPKQMFNDGNIVINSYKRQVFDQSELANCLTVTYRDGDDNYKPQKIKLFANDWTQETSSEKNIAFNFCTDFDSIKDRCDKLFNYNTYATEGIEFTADVDSLNAQPTDLAYVTMSRLSKVGKVHGRIKSVTLVSGTTYTITWDEPWEITNGNKGFRYRVASPSGSLGYDEIVTVNFTWSSGASTITSLNLDIGANPVPEVYTIFSAGIVDYETETVRITEINRESNNEATISAVVYDSHIHSDTTPSITPVYETAYDYSTENLTANIKNSPGTSSGIKYITLKWQNADPRIKKRAIYYRKTFYDASLNETTEDKWTFYDLVEDTSIDIYDLNLDLNVSYNFAICGIGFKGEVEEPNLADSVSLKIEDTFYPADISSASLSWNGDELKLALTQNKEVDIDYYELRFSSDNSGWDDASTILVGQIKPSALYDYSFDAKAYLTAGNLATAKFYIAARNKDQLYSENPTTLDIPSQATVTLSGGSYSFTVRDAYFNWATSTRQGLAYYKIEVCSSGFGAVLGTYTIKGEAFQLPFALNTTLYTSPSRNVYLEVTYVDIFGIERDSLQITATKTAPTVSAKSTTDITGGLRVDFTASNYYNKVAIKKGTVSGSLSPYKTYNEATPFVVIPGDSGTTLYYTITLSDDFGAGATSSEGSGTPQYNAIENYNMDIPILEGFTWTEGASVSWTEGKVNYRGTTYTITADSTTDKYIYWEVGNTTFSHSNTKPTIDLPEGGTDTWLMALYENSKTTVVMGIKILHAGLLQASTITAELIGTNEIITNTANIANAVVTTANIDSINTSVMTVGTTEYDMLAALKPKVINEDFKSLWTFDKNYLKDNLTGEDPYYTGTLGIIDADRKIESSGGDLIIYRPLKDKFEEINAVETIFPVANLFADSDDPDTKWSHNGTGSSSHSKTTFPYYGVDACKLTLSGTGSEWRTVYSGGITIGAPPAYHPRFTVSFWYKSDVSYTNTGGVYGCHVKLLTSGGSTITTVPLYVQFIGDGKWRYFSQIITNNYPGTALKLGLQFGTDGAATARNIEIAAPMINDFEVDAIWNDSTPQSATEFLVNNELKDATEGLISCTFTPKTYYSFSGSTYSIILDARSTTNPSCGVVIYQEATNLKIAIDDNIASAETHTIALGAGWKDTPQNVTFDLSSATYSKIYYNGVLVYTTTAIFDISEVLKNDYIRLGDDYNSNYNSQTIFHELKMLSATRTEDWIAADYQYYNDEWTNNYSLNTEKVKITPQGFSLESDDGKSGFSSTGLTFESDDGNSGFSSTGLYFESDDGSITFNPTYGLSMQGVDSAERVSPHTIDKSCIFDLQASNLSYREAIRNIAPNNYNDEEYFLETDYGLVTDEDATGEDVIITKDFIEKALCVEKATTNQFPLVETEFTSGLNYSSSSGTKISSGGLGNQPYLELQCDAVSNSYMYLSGYSNSSNDYTNSIYVRANSLSEVGKKVGIGVAFAETSSVETVTLTSEWQRITQTITSPSQSTTILSVILNLTGGCDFTTGDVVDICMPQGEFSLYATSYVTGGSSRPLGKYEFNQGEIGKPSNYTIEYIFKPKFSYDDTDQPGYYFLDTYDGTGTTLQVWYSPSDKKINLYFGAYSYETSAFASDADWKKEHSIVISHTGGSYPKFYFDGELITTSSTAYTTMLNEYFRIGSVNGGANYNCNSYIYRVKIYNEEKSADWIKNRYLNKEYREINPVAQSWGNMNLSWRGLIGRSANGEIELDFQKALQTIRDSAGTEIVRIGKNAFQLSSTWYNGIYVKGSMLLESDDNTSNSRIILDLKSAAQFKIYDGSDLISAMGKNAIQYGASDYYDGIFLAENTRLEMRDGSYNVLFTLAGDAGDKNARVFARAGDGYACELRNNSTSDQTLYVHNEAGTSYTAISTSGGIAVGGDVSAADYAGTGTISTTSSSNAALSIPNGRATIGGLDVEGSQTIDGILTFVASSARRMINIDSDGFYSSLANARAGLVNDGDVAFYWVDAGASSSLGFVIQMGSYDYQFDGTRL